MTAKIEKLKAEKQSASVKRISQGDKNQFSHPDMQTAAMTAPTDWENLKGRMIENREWEGV